MWNIKSKLALVLASALAIAQPVIAHASEFVQATAYHAHVVATKYMGAIGAILYSSTIPEAFVVKFDDTIRLQAQQKESRLEATVFDRGDVVGESFTANRLAPLDDTPEINDRHGDTVLSDITHSRRDAQMRDFYQALLVDRNDEPKVLANPSGAYMTSLINAWNRRKDGIIYEALLGASRTKDGSLVNLPASQKILAGGTAFSKSKLILARSIFRANEADNHNDEELFILYSSAMLTAILSDTTLTSADFLAVKMLQEGDVSGNWMGFKWVPYERLRNVGGVISTVAYTKSSLHRGQGFYEGKAQRRGDKRDALQLSAAGSYGAVRVEEEKVVEIQYQ